MSLTRALKPKNIHCFVVNEFVVNDLVLYLMALAMFYTHRALLHHGGLLFWCHYLCTIRRVFIYSLPVEGLPNLPYWEDQSVHNLFQVLLWGMNHFLANNPAPFMDDGAETKIRAIIQYLDSL